MGIPSHKLWWFLRLCKQLSLLMSVVCGLPVSLNCITQWQNYLALGSFLLHEYQKFCCKVLMDFIPEWMPSYLQHYTHIFTASESRVHMHNINFESWSTLYKELYGIMLQNKSHNPILKLESSFLITLFKLS